jgi:hypothetical protein
VTSSTDLARFKRSDWELINERAERFEQAWRQEGKPVDLDPFLPPPGAPLRLAVLHELIKTDLEMRWRAKERGVLEDYLQRFPELGDALSLPPSLLYEEYRARSLFGDHPDLDQYRQRFPAQFERFEQIVKAAPLPAQPPPAPVPHDTAASGPLPTLPPSLAPPVPTPVAPPAPPGDQLLPSEGYVLGEEIGHGEFGTVCRALAPGGVEVAVKRIHRPLSDKLSQRELKALELIRQLRHPFLIQTHNYWSSKDRLVIVMELADGSLADWMKDARAAGHGGIPPAELVRYFLEAAEALDFLHDHNVMHRDVKPGNLLHVGGHAKVADFGLVRLQEDRLEQATLFGGTALYLPPEGWRNQVSIHSDQYSLAVTYAEARLGRRIVTGKSLPDIMLEHLNGTPDLEGLPEAEKQVVRKALCKDPEGRYPSCLAFVRALAEAVKPPAPAETPAAPRRKWLLALAAVLLVAGVVALLGVLFWGPSAELPPGFVKDPDPATKAEDVYGKPRYSRIRYLLPDADPLVFLLIQHTARPSLSAFYIGRDKVSRGQFAAMLKNPRMQELLQKYDLKEKVNGRLWSPVQRMWERPEWQAKWADARLPMTDVTPTEAYCFAACLGGDLSTAMQWDKAGGRYDGKVAPCDEKQWRQRPEWEPVGNSSADTSIFGCTDMSGNGREWVRDVDCNGVTKFVPLQKPMPEYRVDRRGNSLASKDPFLFKEIDANPDNRPYGAALEDTGFRVVVEINP